MKYIVVKVSCKRHVVAEQWTGESMAWRFNACTKPLPYKFAVECRDMYANVEEEKWSTLAATAYIDPSDRL